MTTVRTLSEIKPRDPSNWSLRFNRTLGDAGMNVGAFSGSRGDRKVGWFAYFGWIGLIADVAWRLL